MAGSVAAAEPSDGSDHPLQAAQLEAAMFLGSEDGRSPPSCLSFEEPPHLQHVCSTSLFPSH